MLSLGLKSVCLMSALVLVSVLEGCSGPETKPISEPEKTLVEKNTAQETKSSELVSEGNKNSSSGEQGVAASAKIEAPAVEVIPHKASEEAPIDLVPIPAVPAKEQGLARAEKKPIADIAPSVSEPPKAESQDAIAVAAQATAPGPNEFIVTVGMKTSSHPAYGKGHVMGFIVNGVSGKELVLERGKTYRFDVRTDPKHDLYISSKDIGWGSAPITKGVEGAFTYKGVITFTPDKDTPDVVYYACRNHPYMGAAIHVVNPGESAKISVVPSQSVTNQKQNSVTHSEVSEAQVKQKLMFAEMMANSQSSKRVLSSGNADAKKLLDEAKQSLSSSREKLLAGGLPEALALADSALKRMSEASRMVPSDEMKAQQVTQYQELLTEIADYEASHEKNYARISKKGTPPEGSDYDKTLVASLKSQAKASADKGDYVHANADLQQVQQILTVAIHKMLDSQTIVYDLNFETPADEYEYELKRFSGYEELIPVAIEAKKPSEASIKLMESFLEKARSRRDEAKERAAQGSYSDAIEMMQQATTTVRRALRMVGVTQ